MKLIGVMRRGEMQRVHELCSNSWKLHSRIQAGSFTWMCSAIGYPELPGDCMASAT